MHFIMPCGISYKSPRNQGFLNFTSCCLLRLFQSQNIETSFFIISDLRVGTRYLFFFVFPFSYVQALVPNQNPGLPAHDSPCVFNCFKGVCEVPAVLECLRRCRYHFGFGFKSVQVKHHSWLVGILN